LEIPLTVTALSLQVRAWFWFMPATLRLSPGGAVDPDVGDLDGAGPGD
jgi:hypothetical protein